MEQFNQNQMLLSLALSLDLAESSIMNEADVFENISNLSYKKHKFLNHSKRACYVALKIAETINRERDFFQDVYISSALHDIGASSSIDILHNDDVFIRKHCIKGSLLIEKLPVGNNMSDIIKYHHENYDGSGVFGLDGNNTPLTSQIIRLSDLFELLYDESIPNYVQRKDIIDWIQSQNAILFCPNVVDAFMIVQSHDSFWWDVENIAYSPIILKNLEPSIESTASLSNLKRIAYVFSDIIDAKSPFTYQHSSNLSNLISKISTFLMFDNNKKMMFEIAALLHDIGKLAIPNSILNKNGKLDTTEFTIMKSHTYYTRMVLSNIDGFEELTNWASNHHEKLNGSGYPIGLKGESLSLEERIMSVCDMYEALTSKRPYKSGMSKNEALGILEHLVLKGEICEKALNILKEVV